jgi:hydroxyacylglutathione hydrolase
MVIIVVDYHLLQYTQKNLEFALTLEPKNEALLKKMEWVMHRRNQKLATVPSTIGDELEFNPFMRVDQKSLQVSATHAFP